MRHQRICTKWGYQVRNGPHYKCASPQYQEYWSSLTWGKPHIKEYVTELLPRQPLFFIIQDSIVDVNRPLFDALPSEIIFQQFEPPTSYDVLLSLRNIDKVNSTINSRIINTLWFRLLAV